MFEFKEIPYHKWGPWKNQWGYTTIVAQFDDDDIILKVTTPEQIKIVRRFTCWEDCEDAVMLVEQDRRF